MPNIINIKTKITTQYFHHTLSFYQSVCQVPILDEWHHEADDETGSGFDRGAILEIGGGLLEIYHGDDTSENRDISMQFEVDDLDDYIQMFMLSPDDVKKRRWAKYAYFTDPNGIPVMLYENVKS